jgi:hypothetical protein
VDDRGDDTVPFAALLGAYWLEPAHGDQRDAVEREHTTELPPSWTGRTAIVAFAAVTVVAALVAVMV